VSLNVGKTFFGKEVLLKPDQRVVLSNTDNSYSVSKVDVSNYTSWINGLFVFNDEPLPSVLMRISRYYNLKVRWTEDAETLNISGRLDLKDDYQRVLHALTIISDGSYVENEGIICFKLNK
jgi:ferric-dicitrate binding protein FerR (iron transport regulator)